MRVPILTGLLLASAWTACAQTILSMSRSEPSSTIFNSIDTETTTTPSAATPTDAVFVFVAFPPGDEERLYDQSQNLSPIIRIKMLTSSYENIELYIRNDDNDTVADTITGAANASGSEKGLISVTPVGESLKDVTLNFGNIVASGDGHAFFLVLQARSTMGGEGLEDIATSPLFGVIKDELSSTSFQSEDISGSEPAEIRDGSPSGASETTGNNALNPTATAATSSSSKGKKSGGLATGAIAGIAVGAAIALIIVLVLAWFLFRRRQRVGSHPTDVSTPLAAGYGGAAGASSREFMGDKEAGAMVAESPQSQAYTDQPDPRHSTLSGAAIIGGATAAPANASYTESGHQAYDEAVPAGHSPTDQQPPHHGSAGGIHGVDSPVPSASVARHLVDEDMTADEIARLEEEERELDRQIQEAGRRRQ